jgi:glutamine---fructose-6-phosphate transaminase (isomerizing)
MNLSSTEQEMLEAKNVCLSFDFNVTKDIASQIGKNRIIFTGMGSSLIFPGKQAKNRAMKLGIDNKVEAFFASDLFQYNDFSDTYIFLCSNSGKTKEVILLLDYAQKHGAKCIAVTTVADSILAQRADSKIILNCGFENGVAATKSIIEQALVYDSLIFHLAKNQGKEIDFNKFKSDLLDTAEKMEKNMNSKLNDDLVDVLVKANHYFIVGLDNGVGEEITLKSYEISRRMALFYPDTHIVHGVEEVIEGDCAIIFDPKQFSDYLADFENFSQKTNCKLIGIGSKPLLTGLDIEINETFKNYCLIAGGWGLLRNISAKLGVDIDHPTKASKVGNPFRES